MGQMTAAQGMWAMFAMTAATTYRQGQQKAVDLKVQAKAEESNAKNREIERKRNLMNALSLQAVHGGVSGISGGIGSSQEALFKEEVRREEFDTVMDKAGTSMRTDQLKANAKNAKQMSLITIGSSAMETHTTNKRRGELKKKGTG